MGELKYLPEIKSPTDVKKLNNEQLNELAGEIREVLIDTVSENGGHLASNLGVVELSIALHKVFNSPQDKIVWDVGHQAYVHKLLTGRYDRFSTIRTEDGLSGFVTPSESPHDIFYSGHSSTSVSAALGIAQGNKIKGNKNYAIAVIGDGAFTGGMVYEAMNNAGRSNTRLIVILNNNEMSISKNVGGLAKYFAAIRAKPSYFRLKERTENAINRIPLIGRRLSMSIFKTKSFVKNIIYGSTMFENFGFRYMGPIDGHNISQLCSALEGAKAANFPILLHIHTVKGKGYDFAEKNPSTFHGISKFDINSGEPIVHGDNYSKVFGDFLVEMAANDKRICAVTAAMALGTGLKPFSEMFPERFFDVGIAEEHAVTFCSGLAKAGMIPVFCVYSSFLQRAYDQLIHDGALQKLKIVLAVDRGGFVGEDGFTHQGILDIPFLNTIPDITIYSPSSYAEMKNCFYKAFYKEDNLVAIRYPRGAEDELPVDFMPGFDNYEIYGDTDAEKAVVVYGRLFANACAAYRRIKDSNESNKKLLIVKLNRIKPVDFDMMKYLMDKEHIYVFEECERTGSVGETLAVMLDDADFHGRFTLTAINDSFVKHASVSSLLHEYSLDAEGMFNIITEASDDNEDET